MKWELQYVTSWARVRALKLVLSGTRFTMNNNNSSSNNNNNHAAAPIPVGFRFHPTDEELVGYYLHGKVERAQRDQLIQELDLYKIEPWDLHGKLLTEQSTIIDLSQENRYYSLNFVLGSWSIILQLRTLPSTTSIYSQRIVPLGPHQLSILEFEGSSNVFRYTNCIVLVHAWAMFEHCFWINMQKISANMLQSVVHFGLPSTSKRWKVNFGITSEYYQ